MNKLVAILLVSLILIAGGCANGSCKPCKYNADRDNSRQDTQKALDNVESSPQKTK